jgi:glycosyltransferase involved in cell wall biosynthesis
MIEQSLMALGLEVETATTDDDGPGRHRALPLAQRFVEEGGCRWYFRKDFEFYFVSWSLLRWLRREVPRFDVVYIHSLFCFPSIIAAWTASRARIPYVVRPLGVLNRYGVARHHPWLKRLSLRFVEGPVLRRAAAVHFTSVAERDEAMELGIRLKPVVIPLGVGAEPSGDAQRLFERDPRLTSAVRILFLSRIDPKKNLEGLIQALALLHHWGQQVRLIVAGDGEREYVASLKKLAASEGVSDQLLWLGYVAGRDKADALAAAQIFALPSYSENFGIAVIEALHAGLPCVLGSAVGVADSVRSAGAGTVVETNAASIAGGILRYLESSKLRASAAKAALALAQREYSVSEMGARLQQLYTSVCGSRRDRGSATN